jgi:hypothetical protein
VVVVTPPDVVVVVDGQLRLPRSLAEFQLFRLE